MPILRCREGTVTPIRLLMRSSAVGDQEMASLLDDIDSERLKRTRHHSRYLKDRGYLREDVSLAEATDILWVCSSAELYELLVVNEAGRCNGSQSTSPNLWSSPCFPASIPRNDKTPQCRSHSSGTHFSRRRSPVRSFRGRRLSMPGPGLTQPAPKAPAAPSR